MSVRSLRTDVRKCRTELAARVLAFLRERYPIKTAEHVSSDLGLSTEAIEKWRARESAPSLATFGMMAAVYGPAFVLAVFPDLTWLDPIVRKEMAEKLRARIEEDQRRLDELTELK